MPIKVGLTGGIGSGKTVVASVMKLLGINVFNADTIAKEIMNNDQVVKNSITALFGNDIYNNGLLDRKKLAALVFNNDGLLSQLNNIVHPATIAYINSAMNQYAPHDIVIKEAAIMIESGSHQDMDYIIGVDAPVEVRIRRVMTRDGSTKEDVLARMNKQMNNDEKMKLCDFIIINDDDHSIIEQSINIISQIKNSYQQK